MYIRSITFNSVQYILLFQQGIDMFWCKAIPGEQVVQLDI